MKNRLLFLTTFAFFISAIATNASDNKSLKYTISDRNIVFPTNPSTNSKELKDNWYLKKFTNIDDIKKETRSYREASDKTYKEQLERLSRQTGIDMPFNPIVKAYIEQYLKNYRQLVSQMTGLCPYYMPIFEKALRNNQLKPENINALKYLPVSASALNPNAESSAGAGGLWQFMVVTAKGHGLEVNSLVDERRDPYKSSNKAAEFLKNLYSTYGNDWLLAIAAYNSGLGNVNKAIRRANNQGIEDPDFWDIYKYLPKDTRGFVPAFIAANYVMNFYREHGISPTLTKHPLIIDTVQVKQRVSFHQISQVLNIPLDELRILNPQYRTDVIPGNIKPYTLALPSQQVYSYIMAEKKICDYQRKQYERRVEVQPGDIKNIVGDDYDNNRNNGIVYHQVTEGEDLYDIASRYGMQLDDLMELNHLTSANVKEGQSLIVMREGSNLKNATVMNNNNRRNKDNDDSSYSHNHGTNNGAGYNGDDYNNGNYAYNNDYSGHNGSDNRPVPERRRKESQQQQVPQSKKNNSYNNDYNDDDNNFEEELKRQQEEARKKRQEAAEKKKRDEAAAAAAKKKRQEEAAAAAKKKKQEEAAAAKKKKEEEAAAKKRKEEEERRRREAEQPIKLTVKEGNNLTKLAAQYGVTVEDIKRANGLKDDNIRIGENILIPKKDAKGKVIIPQQPQGKQQSTQQQPTQKQQGKQQPQQQGKQQQGKQQQPSKPAPQPQPTKHTIKEGQNLTKLAAQYGVSVEDIKRANGLKNDNIRIGEDIIIPTKNSKGKVTTSQQPEQKSQPKQASKEQSKQKEQPKQTKQSSKSNNNAVQPQAKSSKSKKK